MKRERILKNISAEDLCSNNIFHEAFPENIWNRIKESKDLEKGITEIKKESQNLLRCPINDLPFSLFNIYHETGSRKEYEKEYFKRRKRLAITALMYLLTGNKIHLDALEEIINA